MTEKRSMLDISGRGVIKDLAVCEKGGNPELQAHKPLTVRASADIA